METINLHELQGLVVRAYKSLPYACYLILKKGGADTTACKSWLKELSAEITRGNEKEVASCTNLALGIGGLKALGLSDTVLQNFPVELLQGMHAPEREETLGDLGENSSTNWVWGNGDIGKQADFLLILLGTAETIEPLKQKHLDLAARWGLGVVQALDSVALPNEKEHFGFHDGFSQPKIQGIKDDGSASEWHLVAPGEFIYGYPNEYGLVPDPILVPAKSGAGPDVDLSMNGTFLVLRQLEQRVSEFWKYLNEQAAGQPLEREKLAAKMVGRWLNGTPLATHPELPTKAAVDFDNEFTYQHDPQGLKCPVGAHVRRANPRDTTNNGEEALAVNRRHRILRRGRPYGPPLDASMDPDRMLQAAYDGQERGLYFLCFNVDINRQFEFIQQTWVNSPKFNGLYDDADPFGTTAPVQTNRESLTRNFTIPCLPFRQRLEDVPSFIRTRGGSYFFFPSPEAIRYLAE